MARIFVSYRRQDSAGHAGRVYDRLRAFFGSGRVFMDVEGIDPGVDFAQVLDERIEGAEVVVAVIGPNWLSSPGPNGQRRIDSEGDYVRRELATALARGIEVIPVLVAGARVPRSEELPGELADLVRRQMHILSDAAFDAGLARLISAVERSAARTREIRRLLPRPKSQFAKRRWARLLLLYEPVRPAMWVLHILFFAVLVLSIYTPLFLWSMGSGDGGNAMVIVSAGGGLVFLLLALRGIVLLLEPDAVVSPWRRWLLLYNPPRLTIGALHLLFVLMAFLCIVTPMILPELIRVQTTDLARAAFVESWIFFAILTFVVREIGASNDPLKPVLREPNWFARLFCIWKPRRAVAWLPRLVYYCACIILLAILPRVFSDSEGNFGNIDFAENRGAVSLTVLVAAIAISARGGARALEVGWPGDQGQSLMQRLNAVLLLYIPWRRSGWAPAALFWLALGTVLASIVSRDRTLNLIGMDPGAGLVLTLLSILLAVCAWVWAQLYRPPFQWSGSQAGAAAQR